MLSLIAWWNKKYTRETSTQTQVPTLETGVQTASVSPDSPGVIDLEIVGGDFDNRAIEELLSN